MGRVFGHRNQYLCYLLFLNGTDSWCFIHHALWGSWHHCTFVFRLISAGCQTGLLLHYFYRNLTVVWLNKLSVSSLISSAYAWRPAVYVPIWSEKFYIQVLLKVIELMVCQIVGMYGLLISRKDRIKVFGRIFFHLIYEISLFFNEFCRREEMSCENNACFGLLFLKQLNLLLFARQVCLKEIWRFK